jgi:hypothetical protein
MSSFADSKGGKYDKEANMIQYGWKKDKFKKTDYLHKRGVAVSPDMFSAKQHLTIIRNQDGVSACVGYGIGINLNSVKMQLGIYGNPNDINLWSSPQFIYNGARFIEGTLSIDCGCEPRNALDWTVQYGILLEQYWPNEPAVFDAAAPSTARIEEANRYKGFQYYRVVDSIDGLCDAISMGPLGHFVSIGSPWFNEWEDVPSDGRLPIPTKASNIAGGHETCFHGYDKNKAVFYGANSWGRSWGDGGLYIMPFEAIDIFLARGGYDAHYIVFTPEIDPAPVPTPTPSPCPWGNGLTRLVNAGLALAGRNGRIYYRNP